MSDSMQWFYIVYFLINMGFAVKYQITDENDKAVIHILWMILLYLMFTYGGFSMVSK